MPFLVKITGNPPDQIIELKDDETVIGRSPECHIVLDPNGVSRRHAEIYRKGREFFLADLNSRNMTKVNKPRSSRTQHQLLHQGDRINICDVEFSFTTPRPDERQSARATASSIVTDGEDDTSDPAHPRRLALDSQPGQRSGPRSSSRRSSRSPATSPASSKIDAVAPKILDSLMELFPQAERLFLVLVDPATKRLIRKAFQSYRPDKRSASNRRSSDRPTERSPG